MATLKTDSPLSQRIARSFLQFLNSVEPSAGVDSEALDVAKECLVEVFKIDQSSLGSQPNSDSLIDIFSSREANARHVVDNGGVSDAPATSLGKKAEVLEDSRSSSEELKVRLKKLEEAADRKAYQELVKDITPKNSVEEPFSSYKDQLGFGLHVVLTMFTGYFFGYAAFRALFSHSPAMSVAGGILGLVIGMLVETLLFIVRYSDQERPSPSSSRLKIKKNQ